MPRKAEDSGVNTNTSIIWMDRQRESRLHHLRLPERRRQPYWLLPPLWRYWWCDTQERVEAAHDVSGQPPLGRLGPSKIISSTNISEFQNGQRHYNESATYN